MVHEAFCLDSQGVYLWGVDDFIGDSIDARWRGNGNAGGSINVIDAQTGGICRIATDVDQNDNFYLDWGDYRSLLVSKKVTFEFRLKLTSITDVTTKLALRALDTNDEIYFEYNSGVANWVIYSQSAGSTSGNTGIAADTNYHIFKIECFPTGEIHYYINDVETTNSPITANITALSLQPYLWILTKANPGAKSMDIDYIQWRQLI